MELAEPILIMALPRSGSSMTAGIFAKHGVWTGQCRPGADRNPKGFFEGIAIKKALMEMHDKIVHKGVLAQRKPGFRSLVQRLFDEEGYPGGPWLWKGSCLYWPVWFEFEPKWIVCRRDPEATFKSCRDAPKVFGSSLSDDQLRRNILFHHAQMDHLVGEFGAVEVDTNAVAHGDFESIGNALEYAGIEPNFSAIAEFVDVDLWHYQNP